MKYMTVKTKYLVILTFFSFAILYCGDQQIVEGNIMNDSEVNKINIIFGDTTLTAVLENNPTARDFVSLLPLDLELKDYAGTEKISYLPKKLSREEAPSGFDPSIGDITLYAPWGNLAIFYKDFGYAEGLIKIGHISDGVEILKKHDTLKVRMELVRL